VAFIDNGTYGHAFHRSANGKLRPFETNIETQIAVMRQASMG